MPRLVPQEKRERVIALAAGGVTMTEIEHETGITRPTIRSILAGAGITVRSNRLTPETKVAVCTLYQRGLGCDTIARELDVSRSVVLQTLKAAGVARRPLSTSPGALKELPLPVIADRHLAGGESLLDLAAEFGVSYAGLRERLERDGLIPITRRGKFNAFEFIQAWQEAESLDEIAERLGIPRGLASARATRYRAQGVPLKRFGSPLDWSELAEFAALFAEPEE